MGLSPRSGAAAAAAGAGANAREDKVFHIGHDDLAALKQRPYWRIRRALDVAGALSLLMVLSPVMLCVAILIAIDVGLPVVFWQQRPGLNGRPFKLYKFRTMAAAHKANGERTPDDERTSDIGRFLRRTRLDELPQLLSILTGEMSFIGPRPLLPVDQPAAFSARLLVRPGLTGWAQVVGGREISAADKAALDIWYILNASPALDLEIVTRTVSMVLFGEGVDVLAVRRAWRELQRAGVCTVKEPNIGGVIRQGSLPHERRDRGAALCALDRADPRAESLEDTRLFGG
ncbi:MAG: sugar transferase [Alphaproteobacteria bacterium]|nr:sugar transferase [Alphaproteobacteria bacterium]